MTTNTVVVLGGGTGGITTARALRRRLAATDRVVLVERDPVFRFAPSFLWVMSGSRRASQISADIRGLRRRGIEVVEASVDGIDPKRQRVFTSAGELSYDRLVVALGAELAPEAIPGFDEGADDLYTLAGAESANRALAGLEQGRVAILEFSQPVVPLLRTAFHFYFTKILPQIGALISGSRQAYTYLPASVRHFPPQKELAAMMEAVGFEAVSYLNLSAGIAALHLGTKR